MVELAERAKIARESLSFDEIKGHSDFIVGMHPLRFKDKIYDLRQAIITYEENLERTRQELAVMTAAVTIYHRDGGRITDTNPATVRNLYKRGEVWRICRASLSAEPAGMTTRELAEACLAAREFEHENPCWFAPWSAC